jgi:hypothetical protein
MESRSTISKVSGTISKSDDISDQTRLSSTVEKTAGKKYLEASLSICQYHQEGDGLKEQVNLKAAE